MEVAGCARRLISTPPANNLAVIIKPTIRLSGIDTMRQKGCWPNFKTTLSEQFQLENIRLGHYPVEDFYKSQVSFYKPFSLTEFCNFFWNFGNGNSGNQLTDPSGFFCIDGVWQDFTLPLVSLVQ